LGELPGLAGSGPASRHRRSARTVDQALEQALEFAGGFVAVILDENDTELLRYLAPWGGPRERGRPQRALPTTQRIFETRNEPSYLNPEKRLSNEFG
jgi:hypothetical protein